VLKWALDHPEAKPAAQGSAAQQEQRAQRAQEERPSHKEKSAFGPYRLGELEAIAEETSETERRAESAERELMAWKTADFMEDRLGEEYDALIVSVQKFGFFIELTEIFVEGLVPIDRIEEFTGERAYYREQDHAIVSGSGHAQRGGASGSRSSEGQKKKSAGGAPKSSRNAAPSRQIWKLGDRIRVRAERIDPIRRRVEFAPLP